MDQKLHSYQQYLWIHQLGRWRCPGNVHGVWKSLGAVTHGRNWYSVCNKVTHLNIFSSFLSVVGMKSIAQDEDWENMGWILHGNARSETVDINESLANFSPAFFSGWETCNVYATCKNLGSRAPAVTTLEDWILLQTFWERRSIKRDMITCKFDYHCQTVWSEVWRSLERL